MVAPETTPLILFSGLAADSDVFAPQKLAFPQLIVPRWPKPLPSETLGSYCDRLAKDLQPYAPAIIGGASFGGVIALHVAERLDSLAVLLIGSVRSPSELSRLTRVARSLKPLIRVAPLRMMQFCSTPLMSKFAKRVAPHYHGLAKQFRNSDPVVFKWSLARLLDWSSTPNIRCPVFQIHGDRDFVIPMRYTHPDTIVPGGGHVISLTHAADVNGFIRSAMSRAVGEPSDAREPSMGDSLQH